MLNGQVSQIASQIASQIFVDHHSHSVPAAAAGRGALDNPSDGADCGAFSVYLPLIPGNDSPSVIPTPTPPSLGWTGYREREGT